MSMMELTFDEKIAAYLRENLRLEVTPRYSEGGFEMDCAGSIKLVLNGEVISEVSL